MTQKHTEEIHIFSQQLTKHFTTRSKRELDKLREKRRYKLKLGKVLFN